MRIKTKKRWKRGVAALMALSLGLLYAPEISLAGDGDNNDTYLTADAIYANSTVTGTVVKSTDQVDYYKYTVAQSGYFTVKLNRVGTTGAMSVAILDGNNSKLESSAKTSFTSNVYDFGVGESVYIAVTGTSTKTTEYTLTVNAVTASDWETEYNDDSSTATVLPNGQWINGNKYKSSDYDWYKYTIQQPGYIQFEAEQVDSVGGTVYIYDNDVEKLETGSLSKSLTSKKYCDEVGKTFYLRVYTSSVGKQYHVRAVFTPSTEWESENNNTLETANVIGANQTLSGSILKSSDADYYSFVSKGTGCYNFSFNNVDANTNARWKLTLYDAKKKQVQSLITGKDMETNLRTLNFRKGDTVYLKVEKSANAACGVEYSVTLNYEADSNWEQEPNDTFAGALTLKKGKAKTGNIYSASDVDYYTYTAAKSSTIQFNFTASSVDVGTGWNVYIYNKSKKEINKVIRLKDSTTITVKAKKGQKYYMAVKPASTSSSAKMLGVSYEVEVN